MWREPGFNTRNNQAREAKALPLDAVLGKPVARVDGRMVANVPNLQQLPRLVPVGPVPMPAMRNRRAVVIDGCECRICRDARREDAQRLNLERQIRYDRRLVENVMLRGGQMNPFVAGPAPQAIGPAGPQRATEADVEAAKATAIKAGKINQALCDAFSMIPGRVRRSSYAKDQPWMDEVTWYMEDQGWKYAGGGYFSVVFTKGELAIKVGTKAEDSGAAYAAWARDNQGLAGVPIIHHIERFGRQSYIVVMPRYQEVKDYEEARRVQTGRMGAVSDTYDKIVEFFKGIAQLDLHGDNIMRDPVTGTIIITDPVSFKADER